MGVGAQSFNDMVRTGKLLVDAGILGAVTQDEQDTSFIQRHDLCKEGVLCPLGQQVRIGSAFCKSIVHFRPERERRRERFFSHEVLCTGVGEQQGSVRRNCQQTLVQVVEHFLAL